MNLGWLVHCFCAHRLISSTGVFSSSIPTTRWFVATLKLQLKSRRMVPSQPMPDVGNLKDERVAEEFANRLSVDLGGLGALGNPSWMHVA